MRSNFGKCSAAVRIVDQLYTDSSDYATLLRNQGRIDGTLGAGLRMAPEQFHGRAQMGRQLTAGVQVQRTQGLRKHPDARPEVSLVAICSHLGADIDHVQLVDLDLELYLSTVFH